MRQLRKTPFRQLPLLLLLTWLCAGETCLGQVGIGALHIGAGIRWVSTPDAYVVLDKMDLQYDADPFLLNNVFRFTGTGTTSIRGNSRPFLYAIGIAKGDPGWVALKQAVTISKRVNFEMGYLDLNHDSLFLQPEALFTNEHE